MEESAIEGGSVRLWAFSRRRLNLGEWGLGPQLPLPSPVNKHTDPQFPWGQAPQLVESCVQGSQAISLVIL